MWFINPNVGYVFVAAEEISQNRNKPALESKMFRANSGRNHVKKLQVKDISSLPVPWAGSQWLTEWFLGPMGLTLSFTQSPDAREVASFTAAELLYKTQSRASIVPASNRAYYILEIESPECPLPTGEEHANKGIPPVAVNMTGCLIT